MEGLSLDKKVFRNQTLNKLKNMSLEDRQFQEAILFDQLEQWLLQHQVHKLACYWGRWPEIDTGRFIQQMNHLNLEIFLPRVEAKRHLSFRKYDSPQSLITSKLGIMEPGEDEEIVDLKDLDLMIVPGVAFVKEGYRLGYGGGYYDRILAANPNLSTLSIAFNQQVFSEALWPIESHDLAVDYVLTTKGEAANDGK